MRRIFISSVLLSFVLLSGLSTPAGGLRIALLADTDVRGDAIFFGSLFPPSAPRLIRDAAEKISLGPAPQNGSARSISHSAILAAIDALGLPASAFVIPDALTVRRASHIVTREEAFTAIQKALACNSVTELPAFRLEDISLEAAVVVPSDNPQLEVTQITFDEFIGRARFRLWPKSAPAVHPFYVTVRIPSTPEGNSILLPRTFDAAFNPRSGAPLIASPVLVESGHFARLHLHSENSSMLLQVKPLQPGRLGETIRVRLPANGRTFLARVIGSGSLDAGF